MEYYANAVEGAPVYVVEDKYYAKRLPLMWDGVEIVPQDIKGQDLFVLLKDVQKMAANRQAVLMPKESAKRTTSKSTDEKAKIALTLKLTGDPAPDDAYVNIGLGGVTPELFKNFSPEIDANITVSGRWGSETLDTLAHQAALTGLTITDIHFDVDNDAHFTPTMLYKEFRMNGLGKDENEVDYPQSKSGDQQTTIRQLSGLDIYLDGYAMLQMPLFKDNEVRLILDVIYHRSK